MFHRILVGVDRSLHARTAVREAADIAQAEGAALTVMAVYSPILPWPVMMPAGISPETYEGIIESARNEVEAALDEAAALLPAGLPVRRLSVEGTRPAAAILEEAERSGQDLIVVGSRGRGDVAAVVLGSVSHEVVHHSRVPVLVVHVPAADTAG